MAVRKTVSGGTGGAGTAATQVVEEEENTELGTVLRLKMEADSVWDPVNRAGAVTIRPVNPGEKVFVFCFFVCYKCYLKSLAFSIQIYVLPSVCRKYLDGIYFTTVWLRINIQILSSIKEYDILDVK